jgi:integrase
VCRRGEMLLIQNRRVNWETCQIGIPGATTKDKENRRVPFNPDGRLAAVLKRRSTLGPDAFVFGSETGSYQPNIQTAWETLNCWRTATSRNRAARARPGTESNFSASTCAGTTCATRAPVGCWPTASTSASSN